MKVWLLAVSLCFTFSVTAFAQTTPDETPVYVLDSLVVDSNAITRIAPTDIALITVAKGGPKTQEKYGPQSAYGIIYFETKSFARRRLHRLFRQASPAYDSLLNKYGTDTTFQYIINGTPITAQNESVFYAIDARSFHQLELLSPEQLKKQFGITGRKAGVAVTAADN